MREECGTCWERMRRKQQGQLKDSSVRSAIVKRVCAPGERHGLAAVFKADFDLP